VATVDLTSDLVLETTGGRLMAGAVATRFSGVSIDSRTLTAGSLFVALRGPRFDGHAFIGQALARGAAGLVVEQAPESADGVVVVVVPDTLLALQALAREIRLRSRARVIAITGSAGKTTTKEVTATLLEARYRVFRNQGNLNNHVGLPLSLVDLRDGPEAAVVELGMNRAGEIRALVDIARPDIRVWTNVGDAHIGHFGSRERVAAAKAEILEGAGPDVLVVANADDPLVMRHVRGFTGRTTTFGEAAGADIRATGVVDRGFDGTTTTVQTPSGALPLSIPLPGRVQVSNVLAAVAVALACEVPAAAIPPRVAALTPVARRGQSLRLPGGARLIDDSYNASPAAVQAALSAMAATGTAGRRIAVIGEMLELGDQAFALHEQCGRAAARAGVDRLIAIGGAAADGLVAGAVAGGIAREHVIRVGTSDDATAVVAGLLQPGDLVLVKGSRGTRTDIVADRLREVA
jgi:UDP-N-acetylmuramoyl-tripeptide--D-alanyl-D-alanine ligase